MHYAFVGLMLKGRPGRKSLRTDGEVSTLAHDVSPHRKAPVCTGLVQHRDLFNALQFPLQAALPFRRD
jgi:hypothetical protein